LDREDVAADVVVDAAVVVAEEKFLVLKMK